MKRIIFPAFVLAFFSLTLLSCEEQKGNSDLFSKDPSHVKNTITPTVTGNYNKWLLGNIGQYGYLQTQVDNEYSAWQFYIICSSGTIQQVNNSRFHWAGSVGDEVLRMDATTDGSWNEWKYTSITYNISYYIRSARVDDCNEWGIYTSTDQHLFDIKTMKDTEWSKWEIVGDVPESHQMNLVGLFFVPVYFATTQPMPG
jgi:hypothetical protein